MAFIREKEEIKTGFQEIEPWSSEIDLQTDFVMVYGLNESLESRMQQYRAGSTGGYPSWQQIWC